MSLSPECQRCMDKYCWNGAIDPISNPFESPNYTPTLMTRHEDDDSIGNDAINYMLTPSEQELPHEAGPPFEQGPLVVPDSGDVS